MRNVFISTSDAPPGGSPTVAVKDLIAVRGLPTTGGGRVLPSAPANADAAVVARVRATGADIVGKTNLDELGCGVTGENEHHGDVAHPADPDRLAGGSSGGSAAAVALGLCDWAIGTDTGGSIRIPAGLCGVVGVKPTTGLVDTTGTVALSPSLDVVGPLAPDVRTAAAALAAMTGERFDIQADRTDFSLAVPAAWVDDLDEPTTAVWERISGGLPPARLPAPEELRPPYEALLFGEGYVAHREWFDATPERYGRRARGFLARGREISADERAAALARREDDARAVEAAIDGHDALLLPTTPCVAPRKSEATDDVVPRLLRFTWPFNYTMNPVVSLPGPRLGPLPVGIQVVGRRGDDRLVLTIAYALERAWQRG